MISPADANTICINRDNLKKHNVEGTIKMLNDPYHNNFKTRRIIPCIASEYSHMHTNTKTDGNGILHIQSHTYSNDKYQIQNHDCFMEDRRKNG